MTKFGGRKVDIGKELEHKLLKIISSKNEQYVLLKTEDGTAFNDKMLEEVWKNRVKKHFPHYKVVMVKITRKRND